MDNDRITYQTFLTVQDLSLETLRTAYTESVQAEDSEAAAVFARRIRNQLLKDSDSELTLDRMGLEVPTGTSFTAWLGFFKQLGEALTGDWATYRQELRDLPEQEGFPLNVGFPTKPVKEVAEAQDNTDGETIPDSV